MKKLPLLVILLFVGAFAFGQTQSEKEVKDLLTHKWKVTHMEMNGQKTPIPEELGEIFLEMKADGTFIGTEPGGKEEKGKWSYDHKTKTITTVDEEGEKKHELIKVSDTELTIKSDLDGMLISLIMKRVN